MKDYSAHRIDTGENTIRDALDVALAADWPITSVAAHYAVFSIHRFENIFFKRRLTRVIELLERVASHHPVIFVAHPATKIQLVRSGLMSRVEHNQSITLVPRMGYVDFVGLVSRAAFVVTDGGSNQEELSYLGIPTLLMRRATERTEGMGESATLCNYDEKVLDAFLQNIAGFKRSLKPHNSTSPSRIIVSHLEKFHSQS
jgi:UDP-N-acetylglucosamine 2-epimerase (non-hydrolysing)